MTDRDLSSLDPATVAALQRAGVGASALALLARRTAVATAAPDGRSGVAPGHASAVGAIGAPRARQATARGARAASDTLPIVLVLPLPPPALNASGGSRHPRAVHAARRAYFDACGALYAAGRLPRTPPVPWAHATLALHAVVGRLHDADNLAARVGKAPQDWLVRAGYLAGDDPARLTWAGLPTQRVRRRGEPSHVQVTIHPPGPGGAER